MTNSPFFSLIVPTYNRAQFISKAIDSILKQDYIDFELIIVDDGSTDNTEAVVKSVADGRIHYLKIKNVERGAARNAGIKAAKGKYISFLDSDDILYFNHFSTAFHFLSINNYPEVFHVAYEIITPEKKVLRKIDGLKDINKMLIRGNPLSCNGVFIDNHTIFSNLFNEDRALAGLEDWELWLRIAAGHKFLACNTITSAIVQHEERSVLAMNFDKLILRADKLIGYIQQSEEINKVYGQDVHKTIASIKTYVALHLAMAGAPKSMIRDYFISAISYYPFELIRKRSFVIVKFMLGL